MKQFKIIATNNSKNKFEVTLLSDESDVERKKEVLRDCGFQTVTVEEVK